MSKRYSLENEHIMITVDSHGAELVSIRDRESGREYMWSGDAAYWGRVSPVLFPVVGNYKDHKTTYKDTVYESGQHGFARDMDFHLASKMEDELWFVLKDNKETMSKYPFHFSLLIGYRITGRNIRVMWNVMNDDSRNMFFSIGGHPAFACPVEGCSLEFDVAGPLVSGVIDENGLLSERTKEFSLSNGKLALSHALFDEDALIFEKQVHAVTLYDADGVGMLSVSFDSPLLGIWSPKGKNAPFVCIEPWYGRTDRSSFDGDLTMREWGNELKRSEVFNAHYDIRIH